MLWMTQYQVLVMMSAKGRSPVFPDMFSSVFLCRDTEKDCFLEGSIDTGGLGICQRISPNQNQSKIGCHYYTKGISEIYWISIAILPPMRQAILKRFQWISNQLLCTLMLPFIPYPVHNQ